VSSKRRLPLDSLNWRPLAEVHTELSKRRGSGDIAAKVLTEYMAKGRIRSMRWRVGKYPPGPERELLAGAFWRDEYELYSGNRLLVVPRVRGKRARSELAEAKSVRAWCVRELKKRPSLSDLRAIVAAARRRLRPPE
jgi:hypothetical protein